MCEFVWVRVLGLCVCVCACVRERGNSTEIFFFNKRSMLQILVVLK